MSYTFGRSIRGYADAREQAKDPGRKFCDTVGWKLHDKYTEVQRPDRDTRYNTYTTITPTTHVWYREKRNPMHNIWVDFNGGTVIVKDNIKVISESGPGGNSVLLHPNPDNYESVRYFSSMQDAVNYILRLA